VFDIDEETGAKSVKDIKEQDVYMGDIPLMTITALSSSTAPSGHRLPDAPFARVFFDHDKGKTHSSGKLLFCRARHSLSRLLARISNSTPRDIVLRRHRPPRKIP